MTLSIVCLHRRDGVFKSKSWRYTLSVAYPSMPETPSIETLLMKTCSSTFVYPEILNISGGFLCY